MTTTLETPVTEARKVRRQAHPVPMSSMRKTALVGGGLYLVTFISSIPALFLLHPVLSNPDYIIGSGADTRVLFGCLLDMINALAAVGTAVTLFPVVKRYGEGLALGFVTTRVFEMAVIMIGVISLLAVVSLRQDGAAGADAASLSAVGRSLVEIRNWTFLVGPGFICGVNALLLGTLMYRSRLVPRIIPLTGLIGAPFFIAASIITSFLAGNPDNNVWRTITTARSSCGSCRSASTWSSRASGPHRTRPESTSTPNASERGRAHSQGPVAAHELGGVSVLAIDMSGRFSAADRGRPAPHEAA